VSVGIRVVSVVVRRGQEKMGKKVNKGKKKSKKVQKGEHPKKSSKR
jgi:hypothetical protein